MESHAGASSQRHGRRAAWAVAVALVVLLIAILVVSLATGGDDGSSGSGGSEAGSGGNYAAWGQSAEAADRDAAAGVVKAFLGAQAADDFAKQCSLLAASATKTLEGFGGGLSQQKQPCPKLIASVSSQIEGKAIDKPGQIEVTDVRVAGDRGFVIYRDAKGDTSAFAVVREGSDWKAGALAAYQVPAT